MKLLISWRQGLLVVDLVRVLLVGGVAIAEPILVGHCMVPISVVVAILVTHRMVVIIVVVVIIHANPHAWAAAGSFVSYLELDRLLRVKKVVK